MTKQKEVKTEENGKNQKIFENPWRQIKLTSLTRRNPYQISS